MIARQFFRSVVFIILLGIAAASCQAQAIQVVRKPPVRQPGPGEFMAYDSWTVSYSRVHGPDVFELGSSHRSLASAQAAAQRLVAWSNTIEGGWKLAVILIEGDASIIRSGDGDPQSLFPGQFGRSKPTGTSGGDPAKLTPLEEFLAKSVTRAQEVAKLTAKTLRTGGRKVPVTGNVLGEYGEVAAISFETTGILEKKLLELQGTMTEKLFKRMNELIEQTRTGEPDAWLRGKRQGAIRIGLETEGAQRETERERVNSLIERIARTSDPDEQKRLMEQLAGGDPVDLLKQNVLAEDDYRQRVDEFETEERELSTLAEILAESRRQQAAILKEFGVAIERRPSPYDPARRTPQSRPQPRQPTVSNLAGSKWALVEGTDETRYEFLAGGKVTYSYVFLNRTHSTTKTGTWKQSGDRILVHLNESGRRGYSSYSPPRDVEITLISATVIQVGGKRLRRVAEN